MEWKKKYDKLKINFDRLDRHNDVLYRVYHAARKAKESGYAGEQMLELLKAISDVESYEKGLEK